MKDRIKSLLNRRNIPGLSNFSRARFNVQAGANDVAVRLSRTQERQRQLLARLKGLEKRLSALEKLGRPIGAMLNELEAHALVDPEDQPNFLELDKAQRRFRASIKLSILRDTETPRRFLVFVQCSSRFDPKQLATFNRSFDLMLNYYDAAPQNPPHQAQIVTQQSGTKTTAIWKLLEESPEVFYRYDLIFFLDDDIVISAEEVDRLFLIMTKSSMELAQPCISYDSAGSWPAVRENGLNGHTIMTNAVEIMMPCISGRSLREASWVFGTSVSGYGADLLLSNYLWRKSSVPSFVVGSVVARHERDIDRKEGALYRYLTMQGIDPLEELRMISSCYGIPPSIYRVHFR